MYAARLKKEQVDHGGTNFKANKIRGGFHKVHIQVVINTDF